MSSDLFCPRYMLYRLGFWDTLFLLMTIFICYYTRLDSSTYIAGIVSWIIEILSILQDKIIHQV